MIMLFDDIIWTSLAGPKKKKKSIQPPGHSLPIHDLALDKFKQNLKVLKNLQKDVKEPEPDTLEYLNRL